MRRRLLQGLAAAAVLGACVVGAAAAAVPGPLDGPAQATAVAVRLRTPTSGDLVSVYETSDLHDWTISAASAAAAEVGAQATLTTGFMGGMHAVHRGGAQLSSASGAGGLLWQYPMSVSAFPPGALATVFGDAVASSVGTGSIVMSRTSAAMHGGVQAGDAVDLVSAGGGLVRFPVGLVADDAVTGGTEIVMSLDQASLLGRIEPSRVLVSGAFDRTALDLALARHGLVDNTLVSGIRIRVRRSWDPPDPDATIGLARTKRLLGEFDFALTSAGGVTIDPDWTAAHIVRTAFADIGIRASCHTAIIADLQAALTDVARAGLAHAIDTANSNTYGGCFYPRFNRVNGNLGFLSRHTWGQPIDMNTATNAQGAVPTMDCRVVRIFRAHGFAWGGNFASSDGMHFEWVGERRDAWPYPSKYCPNEATSAGAAFADGAAAPPPATADRRSTFFADDGWGDR